MQAGGGGGKGGGTMGAVCEEGEQAMVQHGDPEQQVGGCG